MELLSSHDSSDVRLLIDNARVKVMKLRYRPNPMTPTRRTLIRKTRSPFASRAATRGRRSVPWGYPARVHRGEFDVIPAHTLHSFRNGGDDNLELLMILAK